jgi:hypothetical protein
MMKIIKSLCFVFLLFFYAINLTSCGGMPVFNEYNYQEVRAPFKDKYTALVELVGETKDIQKQKSPILYKGSPYTLTLTIEGLEPTVTEVKLIDFKLTSVESNKEVSPVYFEYQGLAEYSDHTRYASFTAKNLKIAYENYVVDAGFSVRMGNTVTNLNIQSKLVKNFQEYKREK